MHRKKGRKQPKMRRHECSMIRVHIALVIYYRKPEDHSLLF